MHVISFMCAHSPNGASDAVAISSVFANPFTLFAGVCARKYCALLLFFFFVFHFLWYTTIYCHSRVSHLRLYLNHSWWICTNPCQMPWNEEIFMYLARWHIKKENTPANRKTTNAEPVRCQWLSERQRENNVKQKKMQHNESCDMIVCVCVYDILSTALRCQLQKYTKRRRKKTCM